MKMHWMRRGGRNGAALFTVMMVIMIAAGLLGVMAQAGLNRLHATRMLADRVRALAIAEAGANQAYSILQTNFAARLSGDEFPLRNYAGGTYDVTVTPVSNTVAVITSVGQYRGSTETVILDVRNFGGWEPGSAPPGTAWEYTIFSNSRTYVKGSGDIRGTMHANNFTRFNGNLTLAPGPVQVQSATRIEVNGNVETPCTLTAPTVSISGGKIPGATVTQTAVASIPFPVLDLTPFYNTALANGQVMAGTTYHSDMDWRNVPGGVVWINGNVRFKGNVQYNGVVVVTGAVRMDGNANWDAGSGESGTIISRDSTITIAGNVQCDALLYAPGVITLGGNVRLRGQIMGGNDVNVNGNVEVMHWAYSDPTRTDGTQQDLIYATAWQK